MRLSEDPVGLWVKTHPEKRPSAALGPFPSPGRAICGGPGRGPLNTVATSITSERIANVWISM